MAKTVDADFPVPFAFRASAQTAKALRTQAAYEGRTLSDLIRDALHQRLTKQSPLASSERASLCTP